MCHGNFIAKDVAEDVKSLVLFWEERRIMTGNSFQMRMTANFN